MPKSNLFKKLDKVENDLIAADPNELTKEEKEKERLWLEKQIEREMLWFDSINKALSLWPDKYREDITQEFTEYLNDNLELPTSWQALGMGYENSFTVAAQAVLTLAHKFERVAYEAFIPKPIPEKLGDWFALDPTRNFVSVSYQDRLKGDKTESWNWLHNSVRCFGCGFPLPSRDVRKNDFVRNIVASGKPNPEHLPFVVCPACNSNDIDMSFHDGFLSEEEFKQAKERHETTGFYRSNF